VSLDGVDRLAHTLGFSGQYQIKLPQEANGVFTIMADTMSGDVANPMDERTVHLDRYTGNVLANIGFSDYSLAAKTMSAGVALHQGNMGWFSLCLNVLLCLAVLFLSISGIAIWWMRRPKGSGRLGAPMLPPPAPLWKSGAVVMLLMGLLFPLAGAAMVAALSFDWFILSRFKALKRRIT
jgi:uncharacterized iron-regulated membrane protein